MRPLTMLKIRCCHGEEGGGRVSITFGCSAETSDVTLMDINGEWGWRTCSTADLSLSLSACVKHTRLESMGS